MESRNHRTLRYTLMLGMPDARNHTNAVYTPMLTLGPYTPHRTQKTPRHPHATLSETRWLGSR